MPGKKRSEKQFRVEERRRLIQDAAATIFARRGYHGARTREIASQAGVSEGTIYNYYTNKRELLLSIIQQVTVESMPASLTKLDAHQDARSWLKEVLANRLEMLSRNRDLIIAVLPEMITDRELQEEYVRQVISPSAARFAPLLGTIFSKVKVGNFSPHVIVPAIIGASATTFLFTEWGDLPLGERPSLSQVVDDLVDIFLDGLLSRENGNPTEA